MQILINIDVHDLDQALAFYCTAFDLHVGRRLGPEVIELLGGSSPIYLLLKQDGTAPSKFTSQKRMYERHWCPVHLDFIVPDIDLAITKVLNAGATLETPVNKTAWGKIAMFADPFGHGFCLLQFIGRGYDEFSE